MRLAEVRRKLRARTERRKRFRDVVGECFVFFAWSFIGFLWGLIGFHKVLLSFPYVALAVVFLVPLVMFKARF